MNRIQVNKRRFGYKVGIAFLSVKEYRASICYHERGVLCACPESSERLLSFAVPRPDAIDRKQIRDLILQKMSAAKQERER